MQVKLFVETFMTHIAAHFFAFMRVDTREGTAELVAKAEAGAKVRPSSGSFAACSVACMNCLRRV